MTNLILITALSLFTVIVIGVIALAVFIKRESEWKPDDEIRKFFK